MQSAWYEYLIGLVGSCLLCSQDQLSDSQLVKVPNDIESLLSTKPHVPVGPDMKYILTPWTSLSLSLSLYKGIIDY